MTIMLDVMLPKLVACVGNCIEGYRMPILLLTARDTGTDKVMGFRCREQMTMLSNPFDFQELTARIRALLRRGNSDTSGARVETYALAKVAMR